jgi:hypothetical protein
MGRRLGKRWVKIIERKGLKDMKVIIEEHG